MIQMTKSELLRSIQDGYENFSAMLAERIYQENLDRSFDDVVCSLSKVHAQALALVEKSKKQDLLDPNRFQLGVGEPLEKTP